MTVELGEGVCVVPEDRDDVGVDVGFADKLEVLLLVAV